MTIYKFPLRVAGAQYVSIPRGGRILSIQNQNGQICMWAMVDPTQPTDDRMFVTSGTGHPLPKGALEYIGTVQQGDYVWHVFEVQSVVTGIQKTLEAMK